MSESLQKKLGRVRPPRVQITYDVEIGGAIQTKELPFVMGVISNLSGHAGDKQPRFKDRKFVEIDRDNFNSVMKSISPYLELTIPNHFEEGKNMALVLKFEEIWDFDPMHIVKSVDALNQVHLHRTNLNELLAKLEGDDVLEEILLKACAQKDTLKQLKADLASGDKEKMKADSVLAAIFADTRLVRNNAQKEAAIEMLKAFCTIVDNMDGTPKNMFAALNKEIADVDKKMSAQLDEILHHPDYLSLEGSWRGLHYLVMNSETGKFLKIRLLNATKSDLLNDFEKAAEFDQSLIFKKVYEEEYGTFGGNPYSCLVGDFFIDRTPMDIDLLEQMSHVAAAAHAPFISAADPSMFNLDSFTQLGTPRDLTKIFESVELVKWKSFRESEDSRYAVLTLPRSLIRLPYGPKTNPVEGLNYQESMEGTDNNKFCWTNSAYMLGARITDAFAKYKWTTAIRGVEGGGLVESLPAYTFMTTEGDVALKCPTEIAITDRREKELSDLGFIALCHCKNSDKAAFFGAQTCQEAKTYNTGFANSNANLSARLTYIMAASRFAHYIKSMMRDKIGSFMSQDDVQRYLTTWIAQYVLLTDDAAQETKAKYPLREAQVNVVEDPNNPGFYNAVIFLRPHFQLEGLSASIRLVASLPEPAAVEEEMAEGAGEGGTE